MPPELLRQTGEGVSVKEKQERQQKETVSLFQGIRETCEELLNKHGVARKPEPFKDTGDVLNEFIFTGDRPWDPLLFAPTMVLTRRIHHSGKLTEVSLAGRGEDLETLKKSPIVMRIKGSSEFLVLTTDGDFMNFICKAIPRGGHSDDWRITRIPTPEDASRWHGVVKGLQQVCTAS